ncbi:MAG: LamG domain-containing protein, partial [Nitrospira sp.]|nr:LamG domain-containing protein [Nitrospira sp.]
MKTFFRRAMGSYPASLFILSVFLVGNACGSGRLYASECVTVPSGMVSWWPGEGDGQDYGPHGLTGELLSGTAFGVGMVGRAFQGLSEGTGVRVSNSQWLRPTNLSVAAWIQSEGPDPYANVVAKSFGGTMASYALYCTAGRQLAFYVNTSGPTGWARSGLAPLSLWDGRFHFVVGTYDNTRVRLYVDGEEIGTGESASGSPRYSSSFMGGDLFLGTYEPETSGEHPFRGQYDEVAIWNRALSIEEIRLLFEAGSAGMCRVRRREFTAAEDFATDRGNPNGSWSYGWMPSDWAAFTLFGHHGVGFEGSPFWNRDSGDQPPVVWRNTSTETPWGVPPGYLALHPGPGNEASVVRWTAPDKGDAKLVGRFLAGDGGAMSVTVRKGGATLWQAVDSGTFDLRTNVLMGDTIDFAVYGGYAFANTPLELHVTLETEVREEWTVEKLPSGLVHWWSGDGHAEDRVGHQNGRLEGAVFAPGKVGQAFRFQGDWGRVSIDVPAPVGAFTVEAWVRYTGDAWGKLGNGWSTILEFPIDDPTFGVRDTGELNFWPTLQGGQVPVKTWTHVAYTWDLVTGVLYVNGASVASTNLPPRAGGRSLTLGSGTG